MADGLGEIGLTVSTREDGLSVTGGELSGGRIDSRGDHRIAMSFAMLGASLPAGERLQIDDVANVSTSFPQFVQTAADIGVAIKEMDA